MQIALMAGCMPKVRIFRLRTWFAFRDPGTPLKMTLVEGLARSQELETEN